jgi:hypothetical protein
MCACSNVRVCPLFFFFLGPFEKSLTFDSVQLKPTPMHPLVRRPRPKPSALARSALILDVSSESAYRHFTHGFACACLFAAGCPESADCCRAQCERAVLVEWHQQQLLVRSDTPKAHTRFT